jgi:hypothetical protein
MANWLGVQAARSMRGIAALRLLSLTGLGAGIAAGGGALYINNADFSVQTSQVGMSCGIARNAIWTRGELHSIGPIGNNFEDLGAACSALAKTVPRQCPSIAADAVRACRGTPASDLVSAAAAQRIGVARWSPRQQASSFLQDGPAWRALLPVFELFRHLRNLAGANEECPNAPNDLSLVGGPSSKVCLAFKANDNSMVTAAHCVQQPGQTKSEVVVTFRIFADEVDGESSNATCVSPHGWKSGESYDIAECTFDSPLPGGLSDFRKLKFHPGYVPEDALQIVYPGSSCLLAARTVSPTEDPDGFDWPSTEHPLPFEPRLDEKVNFSGGSSGGAVLLGDGKTAIGVQVNEGGKSATIASTKWPEK